MTNSPYLPFWFRMRQGKAEPAGRERYRLSAPNLNDAFIGIQQLQDARWVPTLQLSEDGPNEAGMSDEFDDPQDAWEAAFESYRQRLVV
jgi:hypothetical protein